ncbi:MAG: type II secretion system protein [Hyphomonadaceae bacterium]|nr:type II secretion system protein [Hyphomonadaceae bacterium]
MNARAFTLTEMLVVLAILGLVSAFVAAGAPSMFARANLDQAARRLGADLDLAAMRARREGAFGSLIIARDKFSYRIRIGEETALTRVLPGGVRFAGAQTEFALDPAGRWSPGAFSLESPHGARAFSIDAITGRAASHGADGGADRSRHPRRNLHRFFRGLDRRPGRSGGRARQHPSRGAGAKPARWRKDQLANWSLFWRACWVQLAAVLRQRQYAFAAPQPHRVPGRGASRRFRADRTHAHVGRATSLLVPAMSLMELMVALAVLSLAAGLLFSNMGPWLSRARASADQAAVWRATGSVQSLLSELTAGAIDPATSSITAEEVRFITLAPRLSPTPFSLTLRLTQNEGGSELTLNAPEINADDVLLLEAAGPLRFDARRRDGVTVELNRNGVWMPLLSASFAANAPFVCAFDPIPRTCRA